MLLEDTWLSAPEKHDIIKLSKCLKHAIIYISGFLLLGVTDFKYLWKAVHFLPRIYIYHVRPLLALQKEGAMSQGMQEKQFYKLKKARKGILP